jgi:hypothetical protein
MSKPPSRMNAGDSRGSEGLDSDSLSFPALVEFEPQGPFEGNSSRRTVETADAETQTGTVLYCRVLDDMVSYKKWNKEVLDPFIKVRYFS